MNFESALDLVGSLLKTQTGKPLTDSEKEILKAAWENQTYNNISENLYLSLGHIKDLASLLWKRISNVMGVKVTKSNFRYLLDKQDLINNHNTSHIEELENEEIEAEKNNVLIVDDLIENLRFLTEILLNRGYRVRSVTNGNMALKTAINKPPDLILLDIRMPDIDGYEVCKAIKNNESLSEIPVIFLSALDEVVDKVKAFQVGGVDYITKPFHPEEVIVRIQNQITIQKQKLELRQAIDQHQQTAEILYKSRALLASLLNNSVDGIAAIQAVRNLITGEIEDCIFILVNPVFAKLFQEKRETLTSKSGIKNLFNQLNTELFEVLVQVIQTEKTMKLKLCCKIGELQEMYDFTIVKFGDGCSINVRNLYSFNNGA
jgi:CheY-like chemotaxis protein